MSVSLTQWLGSRTPEQIAALLSVRADATAAPVPRHLRELAERLEIFSSVAEAAHALPAPAIEVIEVLQLLGPGHGTRTALAGWLGRAADDPDLTAALEQLASWGLVWPSDGDQALVMAQPLYSTFRHPLRLGPPAAELLASYPVDRLRALGRALAAPAPKPGPGSRKEALVAAVAAALGDADRVRALVATARPVQRAALQRLADDGPPTTQFTNWYGYYQYQPDPNLAWAVELGLVVSAPLGPPQVPREVAVALRGPGWHAPFTPRVPLPALAAVDPGAVEREAAAAGSAAVEQLTALLEAVAVAPISPLKAGGVGVKELRRLARTLGADQDTVRLWLELAYQADLIGPVREAAGGTRLVPTGEYDAWARSQPAERLAALLPHWQELPVAPLLRPAGGEQKPPPALYRDHSGQLPTAARAKVVEFAASLPPGRGVADEAGLAAAVCWRSPLVLAQVPDADRLIDAAWREARLVGAIAHGALTPLGRAMVSGADPVDACRALLPAAIDEAIFQADLTALAPGAPAASLAELLDTAADREARGGATTWRFSAGSVRRALDGGYNPDQLLADLRARAVGGGLPQPLEYLVADVARRHGAVRVRPVACVLHAGEPALLAEIAGARALRPLQLSVISPTVLGSAAPAAETLAALRDAGYAPVGESADGAPQLERVPRRRAHPSRRRAAATAKAAPSGAPADPLALATALLAAPVPPAPPAGAKTPAKTPAPAPPAGLAELERQLQASGFLPMPGADPEQDVAAELAELAGHLAPGERRLLAHAIETFHPVEILYRSGNGEQRRRVIEPLELDGPDLVAWCRLRDDERVFALHLIASVAPA